MQILPLDPDPPADVVDGVHRVLADAAAADHPDDPPPSRDEVAGRLRTRRRGRRLLRWTARDDTGITGYGLLRLPDTDNTHLGLLDVTVHPAARRRGVGTALLRAGIDALLADGRRLLLAEADEGTAGERLLRGIGMRVVQVDTMSLLRLADADWPAVTAAAAAPHPGYRLERWAGGCPEPLLAAYAAAKTAMNDAPTDDADLDGSAYTPETVRDAEAAARLQFDEVRVVVAVHEATGEVAGLTEVYVMLRPHRSSQGDTAVVAAHRGSGLGRWLKADMLVRLRAERPDVAELLTGNAASNEHMLRINEELGYRPHATVLGFQLDVREKSLGAAR